MAGVILLSAFRRSHHLYVGSMSARSVLFWASVLSFYAAGHASGSIYSGLVSRTPSRNILGWGSGVVVMLLGKGRVASAVRAVRAARSAHFAKRPKSSTIAIGSPASAG